MVIGCRVIWNNDKDNTWDGALTYGFYTIPRVGDHLQLGNKRFKVVHVVHYPDPVRDNHFPPTPDIYVDLFA